MSLTREDLVQIRGIVEDVVERGVAPLRGEIQALRNDIKEVYHMVADLERRSVRIDKAFAKLPVKDQLVQINAAQLALAKQEGITLPR